MDKARMKWYIGATSAALVVVTAVSVSFAAVSLNRGNTVYAVEQTIQDTKGHTGGQEAVRTNETKITGEVKVPFDLKIEENDQKSADSGHSPWKLDPVYVAQVFVSLKISPEGIQGEYPIKYEELKVARNTGTEVVIEVNTEGTPVSKVYLEKLVKKDSTGIWTVVGYDSAKK